MGLWEKAQKNAQNSLHSITIGSSTLGKRLNFLMMESLQGVDIALKMILPERIASLEYNAESY